MIILHPVCCPCVLIYSFGQKVEFRRTLPINEVRAIDIEATKQSFLDAKTRLDVARVLGINDRSLRYFLFKKRPENMYHVFRIPKKDGTYREISAPNKELMQIQRKLAGILSLVYKSKPCVFGFVQGKSIVDNAEKHVKRSLVFNIDLKDFFGQIHFGRVRGLFMNPPYSLGEEAATTIAQITCLNGALPQGAPTSPIITNMICAPMDNSFMRLAKETGSTYSRYADDISFSTYKHEFDLGIAYQDESGIHVGTAVLKVLSKHSFEINPQKVTLRCRTMRQEVTGLTVNEFPNVRRTYLRQLRAILHSCEKYGVYLAAQSYVKKGLCKNPQIKSIIDNSKHEKEVISWFEKVLCGKIRYLSQVKGKDSMSYLSLAKRMNTVFDRSIFDVSELDRLDYLIRNYTFILECDYSNVFFQGSGFYAQGYGLFTCYHVSEKGGIFKVYLPDGYKDTRFGFLGKELNNELSADRTVDYALYKLPALDNCTSGFVIGDSTRLKTGAKVTIIGYPNHKEGNSAYIQQCNITSQITYFGAPFFTVSGRISHGASGGVVINQKLEVVGIIKGGIVDTTGEDNDEHHGFVPIHCVIEHLNSLGYSN